MHGSPNANRKLSGPRLNDRQREAATFHSGACIVAAVPGSGKTLTMAERITFLIREHGYPPECMLGLSFTRNAARAMREHLLAVLGPLAGRVTLSTMHSFCYSLLIREHGRFELLRGSGQIAVIRSILRDLFLPGLSAGAALREISLARNNLVSSEEFRALHEHDPGSRRLIPVMEQYERRKKEMGAFDFDDLLLETVRLFQEHPDMAKTFRQRFRHVLVDEFQDISPAQAEVIRSLYDGSPDSSLWVCGDDWQSIYSFNGAGAGGMRGFRTLYPSVRVVNLTDNYRSTPEILDACQSLIGHASQGMDKKLCALRASGAPVRVLTSESEEEEAELVASRIVSLHREGCSWNDIAVLFRSNYQSRAIEEGLERAGVPYRTGSGGVFFRRPEVRVLLDYLNCIRAPDSEEAGDALRRILNVPYRGLGKDHIRRLDAHAAGNGVNVFESLREMDWLTPKLETRAAELADLIDTFALSAKTLSPAEIIGRLRIALRYDRYLTERETPGPDNTRVQNINQLQFAALKHASLDSFLDHTDRMARVAEAESGTGVHLMTIHRSKGLEFPIVFVTGMVDGVLPARKGDPEEERRICFVAFSRAEDTLYLSVCRTWLGHPALRSPFVDEALGGVAFSGASR